MTDTFRLGFNRRGQSVQKRSIEDMRWSIAALDPSVNILCGAFRASDGVSVPYRLWPARMPRGCVLLLHGAFDYGGAFDEVGPRFAARGWTALAIDQRGFGATESRGTWTGKTRMIGDAAEAVHFLRERCGGALPCFILGESMGAALAVHMAARTPDLDLAGLVLVAPGAVSGIFRRLIGRATVRLLRFIAPRSEIVIERLSGWDLTPASAIRLLMDPLVLRGIRPAMLFGLFKLANKAVDEAPLIHIPTLTMAGSKEEVLRMACIERLYQRLGGEKSWASFKDGPHLLLHWQHGANVLDRAIGWMEGRFAP